MADDSGTGDRHQGEDSRHSIEDSRDFIEASDDLDDEGLGGVGDGQSSLTSLASSIVRGITENGRTYATYGKEEYGMPMDEQEMDRIDMAHAKYFLLMDRKRFLAPIPENPQRVLDLGTGTGIWSIDFADEHPSAEVTGVDIAPIQPKWIPPNIRFEIDDIEQTWTWPPEHFDYIFSRDLLFAIRDWPRLIAQAFEGLKPGGWIEFQSIYGVLGCDDDTLPKDSAFREYDRHLRAASVHVGTPLEDPDKWKQWFTDAGFELVTQKIYKIPSNPWAKDKDLKLIGAFELENFIRGLEGMSLRIFEKGLGWSAAETSVFCAKVRDDIRNRKYHSYYPFYVVYARKPERPISKPEAHE